MKRFSKFIQESVELDESIDHNQVLVKEVPNRFDSSKTTHQIMHSDKKIISSLKKNASDHAKKHLAGAYRDDSDIVHKATGKTMATIKKGTTMGDLHKQVHNYIDKNHPQKAKSTVEHPSNTRSIVSASDEHAANLKNKFHGKDSTVRIMKRKEGNKVYIDSKNPEHHKTVVSKLNSMHEEVELGEAKLSASQRDRLDDLILNVHMTTHPEYDGDEEPTKYLNMIRKEFGDKVAKQVDDGIEKAHWGRDNRSGGNDKLSWRKGGARITKSGKMNAQDVKALKNRIKQDKAWGGITKAVKLPESIELEEKLKASDDMGDWVKDFQDSDAPQFKGKSQKKRQQMAIAAKLDAEREAGMRKEEVELDEVSDKKLDAYRQKAFADQPSGDDGSDKYRKRKFGRDLAFAKQTGRAKVLATKESVEELDELKKSTLGSYIKKSAAERGHAGVEAGASGSGSKDQKDAMSTMKKRLKGIKMATDKLTKESVEELDEELEFAKRVHGSGPDVHDIFHKGKFVGSIGKHFPRNGRPEGYHVLQYTSGRVPKGARGAHRHERINSHDDAKKLVAKHFNEEVELDEASDLRVTKVYNKFPKKATYAVHSPDRKYYKEFDTEADAKKHLETKK